MFIAPRPEVEDDPLFAVRLALMPVAGFAIGIALQSPMMMIYPTMMYSLMATNRKAFDIKRALGAPVIFSAMLWIMSGMFGLFYQTPLALIAAMALVYFLGFYLIQITGSAVGMLFIVAAALITIMGLGSYEAMALLRSEMTKAAFFTAVVSPFLYMLLPVRTKEMNVDVYIPADENGRVTRAVIRTAVMLAFTLYLYTILDFGNVILAIGAMFVLVFSTRDTVWRETGVRSFAVTLGGLLSLLVLGILTISSHVIVLAGVVFLVVLWLAHKMMTGRLPSMAYQDAGGVMISLVGGALTTSDPAFGFIQRAGLTIIGALAAAVIIRMLDMWLVPRPEAAKAVPAQ